MMQTYFLTKKSTLQVLIEQRSSENNMDIVILTVNTTNGKYMQDFADDYYDYNGTEMKIYQIKNSSKGTQWGYVQYNNTEGWIALSQVDYNDTN